MTTPPTEAQELAAYLAQRDCPCPACGYNLRGLQGSRCPECNQELRVAVALTDAGFGRILGVLLPLAISGGILALVVAVVIVMCVIDWHFPSQSERPMLVYLGIVSSVLLFLAVRAGLPSGRRWIRGLRSQQKNAAIVSAVLAGLLAVAGWVAMVR